MIIYDGPIEKIIDEYSKDKNLKVVFEKKVLKHDLENIGTITKFNSYEAEISIAKEKANEKIAQLISKYPVKDLNISNVTLEEVIADIFGKKKKMF